MKNLKGVEINIDTLEGRKEYYDAPYRKDTIPDVVNREHRHLPGKDTIITDRLMPWCKTNKISTILDVGADWGKYSYWFYDELKGCKVTALELSKCKADRMKEYFDAHDIKIDVREMDMESIDPSEKKYDLVFASDIVEHLPDWEQGWLSLCNIGKFIYTLVPRGRSWDWSEDHVVEFDKKKVGILIELSGGKVWMEELDYIDKPHGWYALLVRGNN
jgi:hypothetical protein